MFFDKIINAPNEIILNIEYLKKSEYPLILLGAGFYANEVRQLLLHHKIKIDHVVVDEKWYVSHSFFYDHPIERINDVLNYYPKINIIVALDNYQAKIEEFSQNPIVARCILFEIASFHFDFSDYYLVIKEHSTELENLYLQLADDYSRDIMVAFINAKISRNPKSLICLNVKDEEMYYPEFFKLSDDEVFIDCGAFDGDSILSFVNKTKGKYSKVYAFEPDKNNIEKLKENTSQFKNIEIIKKGCFSSKTTLYFRDGEGLSSTFSNQGNVTIEVDTIDNVIPEKVTIIKMDIEGSELEALKGAQKTICKNLPKLVICLYHKPDDLFTIPQYISELSDSYNLYLRHYGLYSYDLVLYAIPK